MVILTHYSVELTAIVSSPPETMCCVRAPRVGYNKSYWKMSGVTGDFYGNCVRLDLSNGSYYSSGINLLESAENMLARQFIASFHH